MRIQPEIPISLTLPEAQALTEVPAIRFNANQNQTALVIAKLIDMGSKNKDIQLRASTLTKSVKTTTFLPIQAGSNTGLSHYSMAEAIYNFVNQEISYRPDIEGIETLYTAETCLRQAYGDCDDKVILAGAMLKYLGFRMALVYLDLIGNYYYQHVYLMVYIDGVETPFDTCITSGALGKEAENWVRRKIMIIY
jgi:hypothetical protein